MQRHTDRKFPTAPNMVSPRACVAFAQRLHQARSKPTDPLKEIYPVAVL